MTLPLTCGALLAAALLLPLACTAQTSPSAPDGGLYLGAGVGRSGFDVKKPTLPRSDIDDNAVAGKVYAGWMFTPHVGIELGHARLGSFEETAGGLRQPGRVRSNYLAGVGRLPLGESWALVGRLGVAQGRVSGTAQPIGGPAVIGSRRSAMAGAGLEWQLSPTLALGVDVDYYGKVSAGVQALSLTAGVKLRF